MSSDTSTRRRVRATLPIVVIGIVFAVGLTAYGFSLRHQASQTIRTQASTLRGSGTITHSHIWTEERGELAEFRVTLDTPIAGQTETTAHVSESRAMPTGSRIDVVLDPEHLDYAEVPGSPFAELGDNQPGHWPIWWSLAVGSLVCTLIWPILALRPRRASA